MVALTIILIACFVLQIFIWSWIAWNTENIISLLAEFKGEGKGDQWLY